MFEVVLITIMWIIGFFSGMIYKHFQVNKMRDKLKATNSYVRFYKGKLHDCEKLYGKLVNYLDDWYKEEVEVDEFGMIKIFRLDGTRSLDEPWENRDV